MSISAYFKVIFIVFATFAPMLVGYCGNAAERSPVQETFTSNIPMRAKLTEVRKRVKFPEKNPFPHSKEWTSAEKDIVLESLARAMELAPGLVENIAKYQKLQVYRVSEARIHGNTHVLAFVSGGHIVFTDGFFNVGSTVKSVLHELIHVADAGRRISLSSNWIKFANPIISELRLQQTIGETFKWTDDTSHADAFGDYGSQRLAESLPQYFAQRLANRQVEAEDSMQARTLARILHPSETDLAFNREFYLAENAELSENSEEAVKHFKNAAAYDSSAFIPRLRIATYLMTKDHNLAFREIEIANSLLKRSDIPLNDRDALILLISRAQLLASLGDKVGAVSLIKVVREQAPGDSDLRLGIYRVNDILQHYGDAAADFYIFKHHVGVENCSFGDIDKTDEIFKRFKKRLKNELDISGVYRRRAFFFVLLADRAKAEDRQRFYLAAMDDFQWSLENSEIEKRSQLNGISKDPGSLADRLFECAEICIKMNDQKRAVMFRDSLLELNPQSVPAKILSLQLLELGGNKQDCEVMYRKIIQEIETESAPKEQRENRQTNPWWVA